MSQNDTLNPTHQGTSYFSTIFSLSLVLFMIGLLGVIIFEAKRFSDYVKENLQITVILDDTVSGDSLQILKNYFEIQSFTKEAKFVSKEAAAEQLQKDLGEDFQATLGFNPLFQSFDLKLKAKYANPDSITWISEDIKSQAHVTEVYYQESLVDTVNSNIKKIGLILGAIVLAFLFIAFTMIDSTLKLIVYSNRFLIKSMQLVGATDSFIRKPFIKQSIINGLIAAFIAVTLLNIIIFWLRSSLPDFHFFENFTALVIWFGIVILLGIFISWFSTHRSLNKYLRKKLDDLY